MPFPSGSEGANAPVLLGTPKRAPNPHGALQLVSGLQDLLPQVHRQFRMRGEKIIDDSQRCRIPLPADEGTKPGAEEEDSAVALDPREGIQRRLEVRERQRPLIRVVERA